MAMLLCFVSCLSSLLFFFLRPSTLPLHRSFLLPSTVRSSTPRTRDKLSPALTGSRYTASDASRMLHKDVATAWGFHQDAKLAVATAAPTNPIRPASSSATVLLDNRSRVADLSRTRRIKPIITYRRAPPGPTSWAPSWNLHGSTR